MKLSYLGGKFCGWQRQPNGPSVQEELEKALSTLLKSKVSVVGASRTDSGVHAKGQVASFRLQSKVDCQLIIRGLSALLPREIGVYDLCEVDGDFHPIASAVGKLYTYKVWQHSGKDPFFDGFTWRVYGSLDIETMVQASKYFWGRQDFSAMCAADSCAATKIREIFKIEIQRQSWGFEIHLLGEGFLKQMVRIIVGTLVDVGLGKIPKEQIPSILASKNRSYAGPTAPPNGLCLDKVIYSRTDLLNLIDNHLC